MCTVASETTAPDIRIRPARLIELDRLAGIGLAAWERSVAPILAAPMLARVRAVNPFRSLLRSTDAAVVVADLAGEPAGIGVREGHGDHIRDLWVAPGQEGRGIGTSLLAALEAAIAQAGYATARIDLPSANTRALAMLRRRGYRTAWEGFRPDPSLGIALRRTGLLKALASA